MLKRFVHILIAGLLTLPGLVLAAGTVQLPATNQAACFDANGKGIPCAGTGQDGEKQAGIAWSATRFTDNGNGTVTDGLTGLVWSRHANAPGRALPNATPNACPKAETEMIWLDALDFIKCLNAKSHAGFSDWRLPSLNELESMVNADVADSSAWLNDNGFGFGPVLPKSQVQPGQYWTSTSDASDVGVPVLSAASAWDVDLVKGDFPFSDLKNGVTRSVWPVRGTSTAPAQLWRTGQALCYDDIGDARSCTGMGEDGEKQAGAAAWPAPRFLANAGATFALDKTSGLIWTIDPQTPGSRGDCPDRGLDVTWQQALGHVACLNAHAFLGRTDWRLPTRKELHSLVDYSKGGPALPTGHPFDDKAGNTYWTATTDVSAPKEAWVVSMLDGGLSSAAKTGLLPVWPVSGPDLVAPQLTINQGNFTTNVPSQTVNGTVEAGATVTVAVGGGAAVAATVTGTTWSFTIAQLAAGANAVIVTAADAADNRTTRSINITFDAAAPPLAINPVTTPTSQPSQTINGTVDAGAMVTVAVGGGAAAAATVSGTTWSFTITQLAAGPNTISVAATDAAGNRATAIAVITLLVPDGDLDGDAAVTLADAVRALRISVGLESATSAELVRGDVSPMVGGKPKPDGRIDVGDALMIMRKMVKLIDW
jgi:Protein of unknown function (DUF1566)/Glucodextranase, domain B